VNTATAEAQYFLSIAGNYIGAGYLPPALDIEDTATSPSSLGITQLSQWILDWCNTVKQVSGVEPILYSDRDYARNYFSGSLSVLPYWVATDSGSAYGDPGSMGPWTTWEFQQYHFGVTGESMPGIAAPVDLDSFNGSLAALNALTTRGSSALPDLTVTAVTIPSSLSVGGTGTFSATIQNQGNAAAGAFELGFYLSPSSSITTSSTPIGYCTNPGLATSTSWICAGPIAIPSSLGAGTYYGGAIVDNLNQVNESSENNNTLVASNTLTITAVLPMVSSVSISPTTVTSGSSAQVTVTLSGPAPSGGAFITLTSNNTSAFPVAGFTIAAGQTSNSSSFGSGTVTSSTTVTVTASYNNSTQQAQLTVNPVATNPTVSSVSINPTTVTSGSSAQVTVTLSGQAPSGGAYITLSSNNTSAFPVVGFYVAAGQTSNSSSFGSGTVTSSTTVTVTASYNNSSKQAQLTVNPLSVPTISFSIPNHTYGDAPFTVSATSNSSGTITYSVVSGPATISGSTVTLTGAGTVVLQASQATAGNYTSVTQNATFTIAGQVPTISFAVPNHSCGDAPFTVAATSNSSGAITYSVVSGPATISGSTVTLTGAGTVVLQASQAATGGYTSGTQSATFTVAGQVPTISFTVPNHTYGDAPFTVSATSNSSGAITYSVVSGPATISGSTVTLTGAGTVVLQASQAASGNYTASTQTATFTVAGNAPTITFSIPNHTYGDAPFTVAATSNSSGTITYSVVSGPATISGSTVTLTGAGTVVLQASQTASGSYTSGTKTATFTVAGNAPTISFTVPNHTYGDAPFTVSATSNSSGAMTYSVVSGPATISGSTVTLTGAGTVVLQASQTAAGSYTSGSQNATFTVAKESQSITFSAPTSPVNYGVAPITLSANASSGLPVAFTVLSGPGTISGSMVTITGGGIVVVAANQAGNANYSAATQVSQSIVVNVIGAAATPTFSPVAGTYTAAQTVTISDATSGATIYYTTNGTTPTTSSPVYSGAIVVSSTETLEAIATATGYSTSAVASAAYTISIPTNPVPAISGISPAFTNAGGAVFTLTVNGSGFIAGSTVYWGTSALTTTYVSASQLTAQVPAADTATVGTISITVQTPTPGGGTSNAWLFEVDSASSGSTAPTITSTTETVAAGSTASYPVTVPSSVTSLYVTCLNLPTGATCSYSSTTNTVTITTSSTTPKGTYQITVVFIETVSGAASGFILLPILLLPLGFMRRKLAARGIWLTACLGLVLMATAALSIGCGSKQPDSTTPPATHQVTSSGSVSLTIQ